MTGEVEVEAEGGGQNAKGQPDDAFAPPPFLVPTFVEDVIVVFRRRLPEPLQGSARDTDEIRPRRMSRVRFRRVSAPQFSSDKP